MGDAKTPQQLAHEVFARAEVARLTADLAASRANVATLAHSLAAAEDRGDGWANGYRNMEAERDRLAGELEAARAEANQLRQELGGGDIYRHEKDALAQALKDSDEEKESLRARTALLVGQLATARAGLEAVAVAKCPYGDGHNCHHIPVVMRKAAEEAISAIPAVSPPRCRIYDTSCLTPAKCEREDACCAGEVDPPAVSPGVPVLGSDAVAKLFHEKYERLAPQYGWRTQAASAVPWEELPGNQRELMVHVVNVALDEIGYSRCALSAPLPPLPVEPARQVIHLYDVAPDGRWVIRCPRGSRDVSSVASRLREMATCMACLGAPEPAPPDPGKQQP